MDRKGRYLGLSQIDGTYNINEIPQNISTNNAGWNCGTCKNNWNATYRDIQDGTWCPYCKNKTEQIVFDFLNSINPNLIIVRQYTFESCRNNATNKLLKFDFMIYVNGYNYRIIIEVDGRQHIEETRFGDHHKIQRYDVFKMIKAYNTNHHLIRIYQEDVYYNRIDWKTILYNTIYNIFAGSVNLVPQFISRDSHFYDEHKRLLEENYRKDNIDMLLIDDEIENIEMGGEI